MPSVSIVTSSVRRKLWLVSRPKNFLLVFLPRFLELLACSSVFFLFFTLTLFVFVAVLDCLLCLVGEIRHLGKFGGLVPPPYRCGVICFLAFASLLFVAPALTPLEAGHSKTLFGDEDCSSVNQGYDLEVPLVRIQIPARHGSHTKKRPLLV